MSPPRTGRLVVKRTSQGRTFAVRFAYRGQRHFVLLGAESEGWTEERAIAEQRYLKLARKEPRPEIYGALFQLQERLGPAGDVLRLIDEQGDIIDQPDAGEEQ